MGLTKKKGSAWEKKRGKNGVRGGKTLSPRPEGKREKEGRGGKPIKFGGRRKGGKKKGEGEPLKGKP